MVAALAKHGEHRGHLYVEDRVLPSGGKGREGGREGKEGGREGGEGGGREGGREGGRGDQTEIYLSAKLLDSDYQTTSEQGMRVSK